LVYLPYSAGTYNFVAAPEPNPNAGGGAHGLGQAGQKPRTTPMPIWGPTQEQVGRGGLQARDPKTNTIKWVKTGRGGATGGGTMTTASNLVFQTAGGSLYAYKADTGDELLALPFNLGGPAPPITYMVNNEQYVAFATGTQFLSFKVGGTAKLPDPPPAPAGGKGGFGGGKGKGGPPAPAKPAAPAPEPLHGADGKQ
jgi:hypothetical protein